MRFVRRAESYGVSQGVGWQTSRGVGILRGIGRRCLARLDAIAQFRQEWKQPAQRLWLSALVGDWFAVSELAASEHMEEIANLAKQRAAECHSQRLARVTAMVAKFIEIDSASLPMPEWLHAIGELDGSQLAEYLRQALAMRDAAFCALRYIEEQDDGTWRLRYALFERALRGNVGRDDPRGQMLSPVSEEDPDDDDLLAVRCATFLAKHGYRATEVVSGLTENWRSIAEVIPLVLQYLPDRAMESWGGACSHRKYVSSAMP